MLNFSVSDQEQPKSYQLPEVPWEKIVGRLERIALEIKSFDARLEASGLSAGWQSRCDMNEAVRSLILDGHLVDIGIWCCTTLAWTFGAPPMKLPERHRL